MSPELLRLPTIPALDHPRGGQIMFRDASGGPIECCTRGASPGRALDLTDARALGARLGGSGSARGCALVRLVAAPNGYRARFVSLEMSRPLLRHNEFNRPINAVDITFDLRDVLIRYILQFPCWRASQ